MTQILVFGSINLDLIATTPRLPQAQETVLGREFFTAFGGKGANQAVAAARLGAKTHLVGRVGSDAFGRELLQGLEAEGIEISGILTDSTHSSGVALIAVADRGENQILVVPGANDQVGQMEVSQVVAKLPQSAALLMQWEIPISAILEAADAAHRLGVKVIFDPAPVRSSLPPDLCPLIDLLTPNEIEATQLVGFPVTPETAPQAAQVLLAQGVKAVVIKLGSWGGYWALQTPQGIEQDFFPAFTVQTVDTVAAGDAFNGALAVALAEGKPWRESIAFASAVAALSTTQKGAQPSLPRREAVEAFLEAF